MFFPQISSKHFIREMEEVWKTCDESHDANWRFRNQQFYLKMNRLSMLA